MKDNTPLVAAFLVVCFLSFLAGWVIVDMNVKRSTMENCMKHFGELTVVEARKTCDNIVVGAVPTK